MSRYVDLDGLSWDGKPIVSKIQEVKTKSGYMQGITVGWLWEDKVPHIDLDEHDAYIRANAIEECLKVIRKGMEELLKSPWANKSIMRGQDCVIAESFGLIEDLVLKKDVEVLKK